MATLPLQLYSTLHLWEHSNPQAVHFRSQERLRAVLLLEITYEENYLSKESTAVVSPPTYGPYPWQLSYCL